MARSKSSIITPAERKEIISGVRKQCAEAKKVTDELAKQIKQRARDFARDQKADEKALADALKILQKLQDNLAILTAK
jgi:mevalonate kinase